MEALVLGSSLSLPLDASHHLGDKNQINNQRRREQRVLADIEDADGLVATHEDLSIVFVQCTLVVANGRHVLDDDGMVRMLVLFVQDTVGRDHVVNNVRLGNLLGAELLLGAQVLAVVVAEMVVACNRGQFDAGIDQEIHQSGLHLGLAGLEVVAPNERPVLLSQVDGTGNKRVLRRPVDEGCVLQNTGHGKDSRRRNLLVTLFDGLQQVLGRVVDARDDVGVALGVGGPQNNDLVQVVLSLESPGLSVSATLQCHLDSNHTECLF